MLGFEFGGDAEPRGWRCGEEEGVKKTDDDEAEGESFEEFESKAVKMLEDVDSGLAPFVMVRGGDGG